MNIGLASPSPVKSVPHTLSSSMDLTYVEDGGVTMRSRVEVADVQGASCRHSERCLLRMSRLA